LQRILAVLTTRYIWLFQQQRRRRRRQQQQQPDCAETARTSAKASNR